ncbi:Maltose/maltodextrin ABC transporter, permease protein MalG [Euzebya pacifica]|uniref:Maltose/maltodextrin ABC transporter, permease protein MalG n=1 Tax=Euzebya pacifica TaxID=1608957 RepID=A0A346Y159_9ACTN|nr:sugar ABC transporter permease [Euzebya pacifica]AXV08206.1 Maltose/maltodextrin ABC transporter, permease protein MalG [Euzebya pacifica]
MRWFRDLGWRHLVGLLAVAFALFPVVWVVSASVNPTSTLSGQQLVPDNPTLDNFRRLFETGFWTWFRNSMVVAGVGAFGTVLLAALAAYAFSRLRFTGRRAGLLSLVLVQMFPQLLAFVAIYLMMIRIGDVAPSIGTGTISGLILVYLGGAMGVNTWLIKGFFDTIPHDLDESARVDGATHWQIYSRIIMPLAAPILAVVGLLAFVTILNDFVIANAVLSNNEDSWTLSIGLFRFVADRYGARWGPFAAGAVIGSVPTVLLFLYLQTYIVSGLTQGSVKG